MGEARRRREYLKRVEVIDQKTGKAIHPREGGNIKTVLENVGKTPCNGCVECCYHHRVDFDPALEPPENLRHLDYHMEGKDAVLNKRENGACVHLGERGCTVYEHRPRACLAYDCRLFSLTHVMDTVNYDAGKVTPSWLFTSKTEDERLTLLSFQMLGELFVMTKGDEIFTANDVLNFAFKHLNKTKEMLQYMNRLPKDKLQKAIAEMGEMIKS
jgi:hypothetical protein